MGEIIPRETYVEGQFIRGLQLLFPFITIGETVSSWEDISRLFVDFFVGYNSIYRIFPPCSSHVIDVIQDPS